MKRRKENERKRKIKVMWGEEMMG
jgi:hypothetical protein